MNLNALRKIYSKKAPSSKAPSLAKPSKTFGSPTITITINNSFCECFGFSEELASKIEAKLTYKNESVEQERIHTFRLMKMAKVRGQTKLLMKLKYRLEELDAEEYVCWFRDNKFPTGLLSIVRGVVEESGVSIEVIEERIVPTREHTFRLKIDLPPLRYYQTAMRDLAVEHGRGVFESAVGTGKSRVLQEIIAAFGVTSLIIAPSSGLAIQMHTFLESVFGSRALCMPTTASVKKGAKLAPIRIMTVQGLAALQKKGLLKAVVQDVHLIAVDEIHHAGSKSYTKLLPEIDHVYYRFGFTGTFLRNDCKTLDMWGFLSNRLYFYPAYKAIQEGFLTPVEFRIHPVKGRRCNQYPKEYNANYCGEESLLLEIIRDILLEDAGPEEQILILVDRKDDAGQVIHDYLNSCGVDNTYISGNDKKKVVAATIRAFNEKKFRILIGSTILGEGIDLYSTDRLVLARGGKSEIAIIQAIGRCVRLAPGKKKAICHDFRFEGTRFLEKHSDVRMDIYKNSFEGEIKWS